MFDYKTARTKLNTLHELALPLPGYFKADVLQFIEVGEYGLALDTIAGAFLDNKIRMSADLFATFEDLASEMELDRDPEYSAVAELRKKQIA